VTDRDDLARFEARLSAATPGPWRADGDGVWHEHRKVANPPRLGEHMAPGGPDDARVIAALRNLAPELLAMIDVAIEARRWVGCSCAHEDYCLACRFDDVRLALRARLREEIGGER
jgi:hypothetical protein